MIPDIPRQYLDGTAIDNGMRINFADKIFDVSRENAIKRIVSPNGAKEANVIHLGACDHIQLIDDKIKHNVWLHKLLTDHAEHCVGFDIDPESVAYCNSIGWENIFWLDMVNQYEKVYKILERLPRWDYLIAGEIVEHLDNPVEFLEKLHHRYAGYIDTIVITVPNAFRIHGLDGILHGFECINTDHRYWFTPYTICKIAHRAGFSVKELLYTGVRDVQFDNKQYHLENSLVSTDLILIAGF